MIRTVRQGFELVSRQVPVRLDADVYLVLDGRVPYVATAGPCTEAHAVELVVPSSGDALPFLPVLRSVDDSIGRRLACALEQYPGEPRLTLVGREAAAWCSMLEHEERALRSRAARIRCVKPTTRDVLFRRVLLAADFIQSHYEERLNLKTLAAVSSLSRFHFARLFSVVMAATPHAYVVRKRLAVARRLLSSGIAAGEVAESVGFGSRSTLFRHLRRAAASEPS